MSESDLQTQNMPVSSSAASNDNLADDLLIGAAAIAEELRWKTRDGKWNRRRVYHLAEQGNFPIHRVKGLGICARKSALTAFFMALDAPFLEKLDAESKAS